MKMYNFFKLEREREMIISIRAYELYIFLAISFRLFQFYSISLRPDI